MIVDFLIVLTIKMTLNNIISVHSIFNLVKQYVEDIYSADSIISTKEIAEKKKKLFEIMNTRHISS